MYCFYCSLGGFICIISSFTTLIFLLMFFIVFRVVSIVAFIISWRIFYVPSSSSFPPHFAVSLFPRWHPPVMCERPFYVKEFNYEAPCGHCPSCRAKMTLSWVVRLLAEKSCWPSACFITLTYRDADLPYEKVDCVSKPLAADRVASLSTKDHQLFMKRFRKEIDVCYPGRKIKFFMCGEYGDLHGRPHYHYIVFGVSSLELFLYDTHVRRRGRKLMASLLIEKVWPKGFNVVGDFSEASARYVAGYCGKKLWGDKAAQVYGERLPPFMLCSQGIGRQYCLDHADEFKANKYVPFNGFKAPLPRYFRELLGLGFEDYADFVRDNQLSDAQEFEKSCCRPAFCSGVDWNVFTNSPRVHHYEKVGHYFYSPLLRRFYDPAYVSFLEFRRVCFNTRLIHKRERNRFNGVL